ncbi:MAG: microcystin degradation protein MlrC [Candidatus Latescibacterota bacterium]|jgi:microcystin degradation protein MlrC
MKILLAAFKQETSTFNPARTTYDLFNISVGNGLLNLRGTNTEIAGALDVFGKHDDVEVIPTYSASSVSGGPVLDADLDRITDELLSTVRKAPQADGMYMVFHGAMAGETEMDPEGRVLVGLRKVLGDIPIVTTYDLHGVITDRLVEHSDIMAPFHTYPHIDMYETGQRGATALLRLLKDQVKPTLAHIKIPMLVRGDELITATGRFGQAIKMCQDIEASEKGLAAGVYIGNPFTDVPALQSNVIVVTNNDLEYAQREAKKIAQFMWDNREHFKAPLTSLEDAIRIAEETEGITIFSDAADATSSGASGDSNAILKGLIQHTYQGKALLPIVDPPAVEAAIKAGIGATITVPIGGTIDKDRHSPVEIKAYVKLLSDGEFTNATGTAGHAGPTAVLVSGTYTLMVTTKPVSIMDQHVFRARGIDPEDFDLVVCKSPNGFREHYEAIAARIVPVDVPGSTSANLQSLPYERCIRPIFPLDDNVQPPSEITAS